MIVLRSVVQNMGDKMRMRKFKKRHNLNLIKKDDAYSYKEIMGLYPVSRTTIYGWCKRGLKAMDNCHPVLFHGSDLYEFLAKQQSDRKTKLKAGKPMIKAKCSICGSKMNRFPSGQSS